MPGRYEPLSNSVFEIEEKEILANAGDDPLKAVSPSWNETA